MAGKAPDDPVVHIARVTWDRITVKDAIELCSAALRDKHREVRELEMEIIRLTHFVDRPDYAWVDPDESRQLRAAKLRSHLTEAEFHVKALMSLRDVLRTVSVSGTWVGSVNALRRLFNGK
jgi:hypothetical protein